MARRMANSPHATSLASARLNRRRQSAKVLHPLLLALSLALCSCRTAPPNSLATHDSSKWENTIAAFEASDQTNPPPKNCIVFVGSSSIVRWKSLAQDFPGLPVINRGFGGSQLADSVNFADRIVIPYAPRQVVVYA